MKCAIILAAGRPHFGKEPSIFFKQNKYFSNLDILKDMLKNYTKKITLVTGYNDLAIKKKKLNIKLIKNSKWDNTKSLYSLLSVDLSKNKEILIIYSDIIFNKEILEKLILSKQEITIVIKKEKINFKKNKEYLNLKKNTIIDIGSNLSKQNTKAEFVGLVKLRGKSLNFLTKLKKEKNRLKNLKISDLMKILIKKKYSYKLLDVQNNWIEIKNNLENVRKHIISTKANTLAFAKKYLKKSIVLPQYTFSINEWKKNKKNILQDIKKFSPEIIIRSSSKEEDNFYTSAAGKFISINNVKTKTNFTSKINKVIKSFDKKDLNNQILIQPSAKRIICNGVVFTSNLGNQFPAYKINIDYKKGNTESVTSGKSKNDKTFFISKFNLNLNKIKNLHLRKIIEACTEIEEVFLYKHLDIEFGINKNNEVLIFQIRPIVKNSQLENNEKNYLLNYKKCLNRWDKDINLIKYKKYLNPLLGVMPDWNPAEIIGFKPKILASSIYEELITKNIWAKQRSEFGYKKIKDPNLLYNILGTFYVNVNKSLNSFLPNNTSNNTEKKFLKFYNKELSKNKFLHDKIEFELIPTCYTSNFAAWKKRLIKQKFSFNEILNLEKGLKKINYNTFNILENSIIKIDTLNKNFHKIVLSKTNENKKIQILINECKKNGTLPFAHLARTAFISMILLKDAIKTNLISKKAFDQLMLSINTINKEMLKDANNVRLNKIGKKYFFKKYNHLRPGTYDITSNNYSDNKNEILKDIIKGPKKIKNSQPILWNKEKKKFFDFLITKKIFLNKNHNEIENLLIKSIEFRELSKFYFTKYVNKILELSLKLGKKNLLPRDQLAHLHIKDIINLSIKKNKDLNSQKLQRKIEKNINLYEINKNFELPALICSKDDILNFEIIRGQPNYICRNKILGKLKFVKKFDKFQNNLKGSIVLIESADPGFDWIFNKNISGLITKFGGANSHMAIRASELNITAAIGVGELRFNQIKNSSIVKIDPLNKMIGTIK